MVKLITTLLMLALVGCAPDVAPGNGVEVTSFVFEELDDTPATPTIVPDSEAWLARMEMLTGLPTMSDRDLDVAISIINAELVSQGYEPTVSKVAVHLTTPEEMYDISHNNTYGLYKGGRVYMLDYTNLCDRPDSYDGRMVGWVLTHELLHTVGFEHSVEMTKLTNSVWLRWKAHCDIM